MLFFWPLLWNHGAQSAGPQPFTPGTRSPELRSMPLPFLDSGRCRYQDGAESLCCKHLTVCSYLPPPPPLLLPQEGGKPGKGESL